jgi:hypothetical protein
MKKSLTYADAGVDIDKADNLVDDIKKIAQQTSRSGVIGDIGGFGGLFSLNTSNMESPVLVSSTDGVGTKLKIAFMMSKHDTIGIDLVAMISWSRVLNRFFFSIIFQWESWKPKSPLMSYPESVRAAGRPGVPLSVVKRPKCRGFIGKMNMIWPDLPSVLLKTAKLLMVREFVLAISL